MWSTQTCLWTLIILNIKKYYCENMENELKSYHNKTNWANFVRMQDSLQRLMLDSTSWLKTLKNSHNSQMQWPVVSTLCQERKEHRNQKVGSEETPNLDPYWKLQSVACMVNMESRSECGLWTGTILTPGSDTRTIPIGTRTWIDVEPGEYLLSGYAVSKKLIRLLRHGSLRDDDGAIEFWRI